MKPVSSVQQFFPFGTDHMEWEDWNGNFIQWYGEENIPYHTEENWKITAKSLEQSPTFSAYPLPNVDGFDNWQDWANEVTLIINGPAH